MTIYEILKFRHIQSVLKASPNNLLIVFRYLADMMLHDKHTAYSGKSRKKHQNKYLKRDTFYKLHLKFSAALFITAARLLNRRAAQFRRIPRH